MFRFHARDLHLVMGPASGSGPIHFKVTIDGAPPAENHGVDTDTNGRGLVTDQRLYQLVRQTGSIADHTFEIEFLDVHVERRAPRLVLRRSCRLSLRASLAVSGPA